MSTNPKIFISYAHESEEFSDIILDFSNKLRREGIDSNIDQYEESPSEGWPRWMENQIKESEFVLVVCTKTYFDKLYNCASKGVTWESGIIYQSLYDAGTINTKFIPVVFDNDNKDYIPIPLKSSTIYNLNEQKEYEKLYWRIRGIKTTERPPLGKLKPLPEKERKTMIITTPINIDKWNKASWKGTVYIFPPDKPSIVGFLFKDYNSGKSIFNDWASLSLQSNINDFIELTFIEPPFPSSSKIYTDQEFNAGNGYFIHIGANVKGAMERMQVSGVSPEEALIASISRFRWMDAPSEDKKRMLLKESLKRFGFCFIMPIGIINIGRPIAEDNLDIDMNFMQPLSNIRFTTGINLDENDLAKVVLLENK